MPLGSAGLEYVESITLIRELSGERRTFTVGAAIRPLTVEELKEQNKENFHNHSADMEHKITFGDLGPGPYRVGLIGLWPCGGVTIYVEPGGGGYSPSSLVLV
jgi:hypothetical protein